MADTLAIERFSITGFGAAHSGAADRFHAALAKLDKQRLAVSLQRQCADILGRTAQVIQIRKLHIDIDQPTPQNPDALADQLARAIAMAIARAARVGSSSNIVVHSSASARFASFVVSLSTGTAWSGWWFENLKPLRVLPVSAAIRTVLLMDSAETSAILAAIHPGDLEFVLGALTEADAANVVHNLALQSDRHGSTEQWARIFALARPIAPLGNSQLALLAFALSGSYPADAGSTGRNGPVHLPPIAAVRIWAALVRAGIKDASAILAAPDVHALHAACPLLSTSDIAAFAQLSMQDRAKVADAAQGAGWSSSEQPAHYTRFGGLILIWPCLLDELPDRLPDAPGDPLGVTAFLALSTLYPSDWHAEILEDAALQLLFQLDPEACLADLVAYREKNAALLHAIASATFANFKRRLTGFTDASFAFLLENMLDVGARVTIDQTIIKVVLDRPKLDVLLSISGIADKVVTLPDGRTLSIGRTP
jgi:hypothetical protein